MNGGYAQSVGLGCIVSLNDAFSQGASRIAMWADTLNQKIARMAKGVTFDMKGIKSALSMSAIGGGLLLGVGSMVSMLAASSDAMAQMEEQGIQNLNVYAERAKKLGMNWAGAQGTAFYQLSANLNSLFRGLGDDALAQITETVYKTSLVLGTMPAEMKRAFAAGYMSYKPLFPQMSELEFVEMYGAALVAVKKEFMLSGSGIADALQFVSVKASQLNVKLEEQLTILGAVGKVFQGARAGVLFSAFLADLPKAARALGITVSQGGKMLPMLDILERLQRRLGDLSSVRTQRMLNKVFPAGRSGRFVSTLLAQDIGALRQQQAEIQRAMGEGQALIDRQGAILNRSLGAQLQILSQRSAIMRRLIGGQATLYLKLLEAISATLLAIDKFIDKHKTLTWAVVNAVTALGLFLTIAGFAKTAMLFMRFGIWACTQAWGMWTGALTRSIGLMKDLPTWVVLYVGQAVTYIKNALIWVQLYWEAACAAMGTTLTVATGGLLLVLIAFVAAWKYNWGGLGDYMSGLGHNVATVWRALWEMWRSSTTGITAKTKKDLEGMGLLGFMEKIAAVIVRVKSFFLGLWEGMSQGWEVLDFMGSGFKDLFEAFRPLGDALWMLIQTIAEVMGIKIDTSIEAWRLFGQVIGVVVVAPLQALIWVIALAVKGLAWLIWGVSTAVKWIVALGRSTGTLKLAVYLVAPIFAIVNAWRWLFSTLSEGWAALRGWIADVIARCQPLQLAFWAIGNGVRLMFQELVGYLKNMLDQLVAKAQWVYERANWMMGRETSGPAFAAWSGTVSSQDIASRSGEIERVSRMLPQYTQSDIRGIMGGSDSARKYQLSQDLMGAALQNKGNEQLRLAVIDLVRLLKDQAKEPREYRLYVDGREMNARNEAVRRERRSRR